ncbi:hypothetical protein [Vibrio pelagius]|uniref:hypothetical protein n=1 Tax=Vibrio pelagius TaxID=28169 RepID=UPI0021C27BC3|nr:hypothetical protein [Vibrio pelagius]
MKIKVSIALLTLTTLFGCVNGEDFNFLEVGKTTPIEVSGEFGEPDIVTSISETSISYIYKYSDNYHLAYTFENGVLTYAESLRQDENGVWYSEPMKTK